MVALLTLAAAMVCTLGRYVKDLATAAPSSSP
jgi:hypothetical protein